MSGSNLVTYETFLTLFPYNKEHFIKSRKQKLSIVLVSVLLVSSIGNQGTIPPYY